MNNNQTDELKALVLSLLVVDKALVSNYGQVTSRDVMEQNSTIFKSDGLFSETIFGPTASQERLTKLGYIDFKINILHPRIFREFISLSTLYKGILDGTRYAVFDEKTNDFIETTEEDKKGATGYNLVYRYYDKIIHNTKNIAVSREAKITFLNMYNREQSFISNYLVIAAGLRDFTQTESGKILENEINGLYRKLLSVSSTAKLFSDDGTDVAIINKVKVKLQKAVNDIYEYIENILNDKFGYLQNKLTKRTIIYSTRNVITSTPEQVKDYKDKFKPDALTSIVGVYQGAKGIYPQVIFELRSKFLVGIFDPESTRSRLINPKTLHRETKDINDKTRSKWVTDDGLEKVINKLKQDEILNTTITIEGHYLYLVYDSEDEVILLNDIDELGEGYDKSLVRGLTYGELLYITVNKLIGKYPALITRYPITGLGSIVPTMVKVNSTTKSKVVKFKYHESPDFIDIPNYPIVGTPYYMSLSIPAIFLEGLSADFDGKF